MCLFIRLLSGNFIEPCKRIYFIFIYPSIFVFIFIYLCIVFILLLCCISSSFPLLSFYWYHCYTEWASGGLVAALSLLSKMTRPNCVNYRSMTFFFTVHATEHCHWEANFMLSLYSAGLAWKPEKASQTGQDTAVQNKRANFAPTNPPNYGDPSPA